MPELSLSGFAIVAATAFAVPVIAGLFPRVRLPGAVLEIIAGIVIGPAVLGWVRIDEPLQVLSLIGLAFLLFLAGLEIDFAHLRGGLLRSALSGFVASFAIAVAIGGGLAALGVVQSGLLVAIILTSTSLGVIVPLLKDTGQAGSMFGQLVIAAASIADFGAVILLSLFFSREATGAGTQLLLLGGLALLAAVLGVALAGASRSMRLTDEFVALQDTSAQIRVRGAIVLLAVLVWFAQRLGLEVILGAFVAGAVLRLVDRNTMTHPAFHTKLDALGYGMFIPIFFVTSGVRFDVAALTANRSALAAVPVFVVALLAVRGIPALLYHRRIGGRLTAVAALLQATSLPFIVAAAQIGMELGLLSTAIGAAMVAAGLVSVLLFPLAAVTLLRPASTAPAAGTSAPAAPAVG